MGISDKNATLPFNAYIHQVRKNAGNAKGKSDAAKDTPRSVEDKVGLSQSARDVQDAKEMIDSVPDVREDKVARLKSRIDSGTYEIDSHKVARKMIEESILNDLLGE